MVTHRAAAVAIAAAIELGQALTDLLEHLDGERHGRVAHDFHRPFVDQTIPATGAPVFWEIGYKNDIDG